MARFLAAPLCALLAALCFALPAGAVQADPLRVDQWHLTAVGASDAWGTTLGAEVVVAVVDTGVQLDHPDLAPRLVEGMDFVDEGTPPDDENGHGTLVAGVVAAGLDNGVGGSGVAPGARLMPVRVLDAEGRGNPEHVARGIRWAASNGASVINLSLTESPGGATDSRLITTDVELAIKEARDAGVLVVGAAGNEGQRTTPYRAGVPVLVVGASDQDGAVWSGSNRDQRTLFAPGVGVVSTHLGGGYARADGTSFSTPIVSGAAAILIAVNSTATPDMIEDRLRATARQTDEGDRLLDIASAVSAPPAFAEQVLHRPADELDTVPAAPGERSADGTASGTRTPLGSAADSAPDPVVGVPAPPQVTPLPDVHGLAAGEAVRTGPGGASGWPVIIAAALLGLLLVGHTTRQTS